LIELLRCRNAFGRWLTGARIPDVAAVRHAMSEPGLIEMPRNTTGVAISRYTPGQMLRTSQNRR
jgi:hypothetical protein